MTGILLFILLNSAPSVTVVPKYVITAVCDVDKVWTGLPPLPGGPSSNLDNFHNPTFYFASDPLHPGKFCKIDISVEVSHLPLGVYVIVPVTQNTSTQGYGLVSNATELFSRE